MADALTIAVQSMQNDLQRLDAISQNVVNTSTPGYRRTMSVSQSFDEVLQRTAPSTGTQGVQVTLPTLVMATDHSAGPLKPTGNPLDIALEGEGYLEVMTPGGLAYTRAGNLHLDERGRLVTAQGFAVQGRSGEIVASGSATPTIAANGEVSDGTTVLGQIRLVDFADKHSLEKGPDGLLRPTAKAADPVETSATLRTGYLEGSNVVPLHEMVGMMETSRHFESQQKLFQGYDEQLSTAIQKLGQF
ncbi:MAG: flagellar hook-basal body protein [Burkholderiales bacterium]|nr:flagellar hook-basal body protein [Burkholderiales bacterium]